ncbi:MAG TPA: TIGR03086 family metal-binding protein [Acidimicrobiales bacterium]|jgi:uncharacterized protein (TIGR03086 family)|nr:TIGR03086 family metal-binding protein [Acidimicrobiales bacterium]
MEESPVEHLAGALDACGRLIVGIRPDQWAAATPCPAWTVRDLVAHLVAGNRLFIGALGGEAPDPSGAGAPDASAPAALVEGYRATVGPLLKAFAAPGVLQRMVSVPFGTVPGIVALHLRITETLVHGWDLARATGQDARFPDDLVEQELAFTKPKLDAIPPDRSPFAPAKPIANDAPALDRLAAMLGR